MVVFTCGHCGESVQKPKVEKHYLTKCRNRSPNLSCMDCFKDFGQDYENHYKCITEEERYSGKGFQAKEKKGEKKQNAWVEMLQSVLDEQKSAPANVRKIVEAISKHNNTPRKKPKFINFVKNVCGHKTNPKDIDQAWDLISVKLSELSNVNQSRNQSKNNDTPKSNGNVEAEETNGDIKDTETEENKENGDAEPENVEAEEKIENGTGEKVNDKKLTKKQRKEEKKRQKYEAELQSAEAPPAEEEDDENQAPSKKGKKKKNRTESGNNEEDAVPAEGKKKKRKRQDTVCSTIEVVENGNDNIENVPINKEKTLKKKLKIDEKEAADESVCLHDQNVANGETDEVVVSKGEKFDWHAVIMSVLQKKGDEMPFKRLQKKVLSEYQEMTGQEVDDRIAEKFIKRLKSAPKVRVDRNRVYIED
ncbi:cell growth-regulating nucleolar protein [Ostrinia nubilalis]|uniref:cell growth-regulating nucleolar protein n=1 Tax=Ostrinia nubilalis TaxID=29057 RepID=UPI00308246E2